MPQTEGGGRYGYLSHDHTVYKKLAIVGDESCNIHLPHKTQYAIGILNMSTFPAEASVKIDGKFIGLFYVETYKYVEIKRSPYEDKAFVFTNICDNSAESNFTSKNIVPQFRGEIRVDIRPREKSVNLYEQRRVVLQPFKYTFKAKQARKQPNPKHVTTRYPNRF